MELVSEDGKKKVYKDGDNKIYSMLDMGSYVGHRTRQWYESAPEVWMLMFYDEKREDGQDMHIEALVDDKGNYMRLLIDLGDERRSIQIHNGMVYSDTVSKMSGTHDGLFGDTYVALDGDIYSGSKAPLNDYLVLNPIFYLNDEVYEGELSNNDFILAFLQKNTELKEIIEQKRK